MLPEQEYDALHYALSFQRGEEEGFNYYFRELYPALTFFAQRLTSDQPTAEEIASEAFIKIWARHSQFPAPENIKAYLYQIVRNDCLRWLEKQKAKATAIRTVGYLNKNDKQNDHVCDMIAAETTRLIFKTMNTLPPECGKVFKLLYIEGKTVQQAASELNLSPSTVKAQKARGIKLIRQRLAMTFILFFAII